MLEVIMPKMGDAMEEGTLIEWLLKEGDKVKAGDHIGNIQTDKATVELTAPGSGILTGFLIEAGETVPVGVPIAAILKEGESLPEGWGSGGSRTSAKESANAEQAKPSAHSEVVAVAEPTTKADGQRVFASPLARRIAADAGISIEAIHGTGPKGRVVERDVREAISTGSQKSWAQPVSIAPNNLLESKLVQLNTLQRITAQRTAQAKQIIPHYYVTVQVDLERLTALREAMNEERPDAKLSINDFIVKAAALALQDQPHINASWDEGNLRLHGSVNIGVAVAVPDGLTMPVVHKCETKPLRQIASEIRSLAAKAKENRLNPDELSGSTFAISNMGMYDVENFSAIINQPNGAIIAVSTANRVPVVVDGEDGEELEIRTLMKITGSFDHRIINGAQGAEFMGVLRKYLESPTLLLT